MGLLFWYGGWIALLTHARTTPQRITCLCLILFSMLWFII
jgi:hypothetical protein